MTPCRREISQESFLAHHAELDSPVTSIMRSWSEWNIDEISRKIGINLSLAKKMHSFIYDFPNKSVGEEAIRAFTGIVFKALDYDTLPQMAKNNIDKNVRIISSLYGILRPDDIIKPYRLDFTSKVAPTGEAMNLYWRPIVTQILWDTLSERSDFEVLDLMPADAAKTIDWRKISRNVRRIKVDFKEILPDQSYEGELKYKTPNANKLKTLRGQLLRQIALEGISDSRALLKIESPHFVVDHESSTPDRIVMLCD